MPAIEAGGGWPWRPGEERRIAYAVCLSLLLHGVILFAWRQQPHLRRIVTGGELTVSFRTERQAQPPPSPVAVVVAEPAPDPRQSTAQAVLLAPASDAVVARKSSVRKSSPAQPKPPEPVATSEAAAANPSSATNSTPSAHKRKALRSGEVAVILEIRADGHPGRIFWDRLPAMTNDKFLRLERAVRGRIYATAIPGTAIEEVIDVFALLREADGEPRAAPSPE